MSLAAIQKKAKAKPSIVIIYGPSGLGKTTVGEWVANYLDMPCY